MPSAKAGSFIVTFFVHVNGAENMRSMELGRKNLVIRMVTWCRLGSLAESKAVHLAAGSSFLTVWECETRHPDLRA